MPGSKRASSAPSDSTPWSAKLDLESCEGCGSQIRVIACLGDPSASVTDGELSAPQAANAVYGERLFAERGEYRRALRQLSPRTHPGFDVTFIEIERGLTDAEADAMWGHLAAESVVGMLRDPDSGQE